MVYDPVSYTHLLSELRKRNDVKWTYISPAGDFQADGERTGRYILGGEELTLSSRGKSVISYADYAIALSLIHIYIRLHLARRFLRCHCQKAGMCHLNRKSAHIYFPALPSGHGRRWAVYIYGIWHCPGPVSYTHLL